MATLGEVEITNPTHNTSLMQCLHSFTTNQEFTDICFICSDKRRVYAHKLMLCTVSSVLKAIILELPDGLDVVTIHLPDVDSLGLKLVIDFVYEGYMRLSKTEFDKFQSIMKLLGIVLATNANSRTIRPQQQQQQPPPSSASVQHHTVDPQLINSQQQVLYVAPGPNQGMQYVVAANPATNHMPSSMQPANQLSNIPTSNGQIITMAPNQVVGIVQSPAQMGREMGQRSQVVAVPQGSKIISQGNQVVQQGGQIIRLLHQGDQISQPQNQINQMNSIVQPANIQNVRVVQNTGDLNMAQNSKMMSQVHNTGYVNSGAQQVQNTGDLNMAQNSKMMSQVHNTGYVNSSAQRVRSAGNQNAITSSHYQVLSNNSVMRNNQTVASGTMPAHTVTTMSNYGSKQTRMQQPGTSGSNQQQNVMQYVNRAINNNMQQQATSRRRKSSIINNGDVIMIDDKPESNKIKRINR